MYGSSARNRSKSLRKSSRRSKSGSKASALKSGSKMKHLITVSVKNGPFASASQAEQTRKILATKGIKTSDVTKTSAGYVFTSMVSYATPTIALKNKVVSQLQRQVKSVGLKKSSVSIKSKAI